MRGCGFVSDVRRGRPLARHVKPELFVGWFIRPCLRQSFGSDKLLSIGGNRLLPEVKRFEVYWLLIRCLEYYSWPIVGHGPSSHQQPHNTGYVECRSLSVHASVNGPLGHWTDAV